MTTKMQSFTMTTDPNLLLVLSGMTCARMNFTTVDKLYTEQFVGIKFFSKKVSVKVRKVYNKSFLVED